MHTVTSKDGTAIAYSESGSGPPLLLVHGTTADHTRWAPIAPRFEPHFTVHAVDRRGRGRSPDLTGYSIEREFEDIAAVVEAIAERSGQQVCLLGHSYGAVCSLEAALLTDRLAKLVLYEPPIVDDEPVYPPSLITELDAMIANGRREDVVITFFRDVVGLPAAEVDLIRSLPNWPTRVAAAHTITREMAITDAYRFRPERFSSLRVPTLLMLGGASRPLFRNAIARVAAAVATSRIVEMPGQQHTAMNTAPDLFTREVLGFLR